MKILSMKGYLIIGLLCAGILMSACNWKATQPDQGEERPARTAEKRLDQQNNPGQQANDFSYTTEDGRRQQLYALGARHTLLFFYNPECEACKEYKGLLAGSKAISERIKKGELKVLALYIDKDLSIWKKHLPEMPATWIQGHDEDEYLFSNGVYDLHAIPTIYLLDRHKKVILKDVLDLKLIEMALE